MTILPLAPRPITGQHRAVRAGAASALARRVVVPAAPPAPVPAAPPSTMERLGRALGDGYRVLRPLGDGGYGEVFLVRDLYLQRVVAVKVLRAALAADPRERERFRREACTVAHLAHPGIVPVLAYGETPAGADDAAPLCWTMMPCASGGSLATRLAMSRRLPAAEVTAILVALCEALAHAHRHGVVHCDLKPDNVLFGSASSGSAGGAAGEVRPLLTDFGIAARPHHDGGIGRATDVGGTPAWMAPEQRLGLAALDARSDVYGLGMLGWVMLAGRLPQRGMDGRMERDGVPQDVPAGLLAVLDRAVSREPDARWDGTAPMAAALARASLPAWRRRITDALVSAVAAARRVRREWARMRATAIA